MTSLWSLIEQVPENPAYDEELVRAVGRQGGAVVPWSGGLDSTTAAVMAVEAGLRVVLLSVDAGQPWDNAEARARQFVANAIPELRHLSHHHRRLQVADKVFAHVHVGRNADIVEEAGTVGLIEGMRWAEIWLGWLAGEMPLAGGDKSHAAAIWMQYTLPARYRLHLPLAGMTKADVVGWWVERGRADDALATFSCFAPRGAMPCMTCQACFRTFVAFANHGLHTRLKGWGLHNFAASVEKYERGIAEGRYTGRRADQTAYAIQVLRDDERSRDGS